MKGDVLLQWAIEMEEEAKSAVVVLAIVNGLYGSNRKAGIVGAAFPEAE